MLALDIRLRTVKQWLDDQPQPDKLVKATYAWRFSLDPAGETGVIWINADKSPFTNVSDKDPGKIVGYMAKLGLDERGNVTGYKWAGPASPRPVRAAEWVALRAAGIFGEAPLARTSKVTSGKQINKSSGTVQTVRDMIGTTDLTAEQLKQVRAVEIRAHATSFYFGTAALAAKDTQPAYEPYYREGNADMLDDTYVRAVADADITGVVVEVWFGN
jgi:hypothetical protein